MFLVRQRSWFQQVLDTKHPLCVGLRPSMSNPLDYSMAKKERLLEVVMQFSKRVLVGIGVGVVVVGGGIGFAAASGSSSASPTTTTQAASAPSAAPTISVTTASVGGQSEQVLVNARGLPLYIYGGDSANTSHVSGGLAALWPPLLSASPTESGVSGHVSVVSDASGQQVQYNGHFLYTFVDDTPGQVTGQGVQNFFVATPSIGSGTTSVAPAPVSPQSSGYGY